jgi:SOS-response transcriptional repressor LexA
MNWPEHVQSLAAGKIVRCRPKGQSMSGRIESGQLITIEPARAEDVRVGDAVFCRVNGNYYVHLVKARGQDGRLQIGNNRGHINGWTKAVYGKVVRVEP